MHFSAILVVAFLAIALPATALPNSDGVEAEPAALLEPLASCSNDGKITRDKYRPYCLPSNSKGFASSHNCANKGGRSYLCVQSGVATCYHNLKGLNFENGECFI